MRIREQAHSQHDWRLDAVAPDFRLEDAWSLPVEGSREDFPLLVEVMTSLDPAERPALTRALVWARHRLGDAFGWDDREDLPVPGCRETTLRERLPEDLRDGDAGVDLSGSYLSFVYRTDVEWAGEASNGTVHAVMHLVWIERPDGRWQGQMGVYVKPRGRSGAAYMLAIAPFRYLIVYPALMRQVGRSWATRTAGRTPGGRSTTGC